MIFNIAGKIEGFGDRTIPRTLLYQGPGTFLNKIGNINPISYPWRSEIHTQLLPPSRIGEFLGREEGSEIVPSYFDVVVLAPFFDGLDHILHLTKPH